MDHICFNGKFLPAGEPVLAAANRGYRYGDGLFETMKLVKGSIALADYHFDRLMSGLALLEYELPGLFNRAKLEKEVAALCERNGCTANARVRLSVFRGNGGLYDDDRKLQYLIECWPLDPSITRLNENGLVIAIYPHARKSCDRFSNLKSASFLPYAAAADYAHKQKVNDCVLLNQYDRIADTTIANLFMIKEGRVITAPLTEGCINGVMRRHLLAQMDKAGIVYSEAPIKTFDLMQADEIFLTNAIRGIRWVRELDGKLFRNTKTVEIFNQFLQTI